MSRNYDVIIVGAGIVGLSVAHQILRRSPDCKICVLDKEGQPGAHQSGHNSGVIHTGIYYAPGSLKARLCREGRAQLIGFVEQESIAHQVTGKVIVATETAELPRLDALYERAVRNAIPAERIDAAQLRAIEPHAAGLSALWVPGAGIVDYKSVVTRLVERIGGQGAYVLTGAQVIDVAEVRGGLVVSTTRGDVHGHFLIGCAGLQSDRLARLSGCEPGVRIVPFRGEYYRLDETSAGWVRGLIYPVPHPAFPFLGVHLTRDVHGGVECGPNAVLNWGRETYDRWHVDPGDLVETLGYSGFLRLARRHLGEALQEMKRSWSKRAFAASVARLLPEIRPHHLVPTEAGIRAQAVSPDGRLVDDFLFAESERTLHVVNAPSPAATSSLAIGKDIAERFFVRMGGV